MFIPFNLFETNEIAVNRTDIEDLFENPGLTKLPLDDLKELLEKSSHNLSSSSNNSMEMIELHILKELHKHDKGDISWMLISCAILIIMIPGIGYFYSGMAKKSSSLSLLMLCLWSLAIVSIQWFLFGYSITCGNGNEFIGNFDHVFFRGVLDAPHDAAGDIPALLYSGFMMLFAVITPCLIIGSSAERARFIPTLVFIFVWTTFVYDFLAYWSWNPNGWINKLGGLDFGGGSPIHIAAGSASVAFAIILGKRRNYELEKPPPNMSNVVLGTCLIWFGWVIANAGSGFSSNTKAVMVFTVTNLAGAVGGITWAVLDYRHEQKLSALGFCAGAICGLVTITPASGYVSPGSTIVFGILGPLVCNFAMDYKNKFGYDDALDVSTIHGLGAVVGNLLTGIFASKDIAALDGVTHIEGGAIDGHWMQLVHQLIDTVAAMAWSFVVTFIILWIINKLPGCKLRADEETELAGLDAAELGINIYESMREISTDISEEKLQEIAKKLIAKGYRRESVSAYLTPNRYRGSIVDTLGQHRGSIIA